MALFRQTEPIITFLHHIQGVLHAFFCISSEKFDLFSNGSGILENSQNRELNRSQNWRTGTGLNRTFGSVLSVLVLCISSGLNFGNTMFRRSYLCIYNTRLPCSLFQRRSEFSLSATPIGRPSALST